MTLRQWRKKPQTISASASWYLAGIMEARGRQDLYLRQSPQRLKVLRDHASNTSLRDRDEDALNLIHSKGANLPFNEETILKLQYLSRRPNRPMEQIRPVRPN